MYNKEYYQKHKNAILKSNKKYYDKNKESILVKGQEYRSLNKFKLLAFETSYKRRFNVSLRIAIKRNLEFSISLEQFIEKINMECYYCKNKLCQKSKTGIGLDRLNNLIGYTYDNVVSCGKICNAIKNKFLSSEETKAAVEAVLLIRGRKCFIY